MPCDSFNLAASELAARKRALEELDEAISSGTLFVHPDPIERRIQIVDGSGNEWHYESTDESEWSDACVLEEIHHHGSPETRRQVERAAEEAHVTVGHHG